MSFESRALVLIGFVNLLFGFGIGIPMTYWILNRSREREAALDRVETTEGRITKSSIRKERNTGQTGPKYKYRPIIEFRYEYRGRTFESNRQSYNMLFGAGSKSHATRTARKYSEGDSVSVYVDPEDPGNGFLTVEDTKQGLVTGFGVIIGVVMILAGFAGVGLLGVTVFGL